MCLKHINKCAAKNRFPPRKCIYFCVSRCKYLVCMYIKLKIKYKQRERERKAVLQRHISPLVVSALEKKAATRAHLYANQSKRGICTTLSQKRHKGKHIFSPRMTKRKREPSDWHTRVPGPDWDMQILPLFQKCHKNSFSFFYQSQKKIYINTLHFLIIWSCIFKHK